MTRANLLSFNWVNILRARKVFASLYGMKQNDKQTKEFQMSETFQVGDRVKVRASRRFGVAGKFGVVTNVSSDGKRVHVAMDNGAGCRQNTEFAEACDVKHESN